MRGYTVRYRVPSGPIVSVDVIAGCGADAADAVRTLIPRAQLVETRGRHLGLSMATAGDLCECGHRADAHGTDEWTGDGCGYVGHGHGNGARHSTHPCPCQGFNRTGE